MVQPIDEIQLQRLVDGVLDDGQRREFLAGLDRTPELWREVALAFVEEQILRAQVGGVDESGKRHESRPRVATVPAWSARARLSLLAVATGLLLVLGLGFLCGQQYARSRPMPASEALVDNGQPDTSQSAMAERSETDDGSPSADDLEPSPAFRLRLAHQDGNAVELPVFEQSQLDHLPWDRTDPAVIRELNRTLVQRGLRADMETEYLSGWLEDGRQIVVPWRTVSLKYDAQ
jgi:hypothetical protein